MHSGIEKSTGTELVASVSEATPGLLQEASETETPAPAVHTPGGYRELLVLAVPFILSSSFTTIQIFIDRIFINKVSTDAMAATMPTIGYFWTPMALFQFTVMYVTVFVAQYCGAKRLNRVGPVIWQGLYLGTFFGLAFPLSIPIVDMIIGASGHTPAVQSLERAYFRGLTFAALPMILVAAANAFFAGRQQSWTVFKINSAGALVNLGLAYPLIFFRRHEPEAAMFNAGLAAAIGSAVSAILGVGLFLRRKYEADYRTRSGWQFDGPLMKRLLKFGLPNGAQFCIEGLAFTAFIILVGAIGTAEGAACGIAFSLNLLTFLPVMGLAQGVEVLVGQRQGADQPALAASTTHRGAILATAYMTVNAALYLTVPHLMVMPFHNAEIDADWHKVAEIIPLLLIFVAAYSLADGANLVYAFALRGAGDTRFVTATAIVLSWFIMVIPTYLALKNGWGLYAAWAFASAYVFGLAIVFWLRFRGGKWKSMKVIEPHVAE